MQKTLATLALILACIAATFVAYYYGRYLPRLRDAELAEQRRAADLERAQRCHTDATKFLSDFQRNMSSVAPDSWLEPEIHFNKKLNTCLVEMGWDRITGGELYRFKDVTDIYSNREIISTYYTFEGATEKALDPKLGGMEPRRYSAEKDKLFGE
jgi:hypothetical protein